MMYVRLSLQISVTTEPIGFYCSGNIPTGPVVILGYFLGGGTPPTPQKTKKSSPLFFDKDFLGTYTNFTKFFFITSWGKATRG